MGRGYGGRWIDRVVDSVEADPGLTIIAAPPGFGVSVLAERLDGPNHGRSARHTACTVIRSRSCDDARASVDTALETGRRVVLAGRSIPDGFRTIDAQIVDHSTMRLEEHEALELGDIHGVPDAVARAIWVFTGGWPAYYLSCALAAKGANVSSGTEAYDLLRTGPHLGNLIATSLDELDDDDRLRMGRLAHFGRISQGVLSKTLGADGANRVKAAGLPLVETTPGWFEILNPVSQFLRSETELDEQTASELAPTIVSDVGVVAGARLFLEAGQPAAAATALRSVALHQLDEGSQESLLPVLRTVLDTQKDDGSLGLRLARVLQNHGDLALQRRALVDASTAANEQFRPDLAIEAEAEILLLDLHSTEPDEAMMRHRELVEEARNHSSSLAQIRLREVDVFLSTESGELSKIYRSVGQLESVAHEWAVVGEPARAAATLRVLSTTALFYLGRYAHAQEALQRACDLSKGQPQSLAKSVALLARMTALLGDVEGFDALHQRAQQLQESAGLAWVDAYLAWSEMIAAGYRQDATDVVSSRRRAESLLGPLLEHETGVVFVCDAAAAHAMAGDFDGAMDLLGEAKLRTHQSPLEVGFAEIFVRSRAGICAEDLVKQLRQHVDVPVERDWRIDLELALVNGDDELIGRLSQEAQRHGLSALFDAIVRTSNRGVHERSIQVCLLGEFAICVDGNDQLVTSGKAIELIKFLAVRARIVPVDVVIDHLWGDVSTSVGARRLKNVVSRAREIVGPEAIDRNGQFLGLGPMVETDLAILHRKLDDFRGCVGDRVGAAVDVVDAYTGPLLELDMYQDWLEPERTAIANAAAEALSCVIDARSRPARWAMCAQDRIDSGNDIGYMRIAEHASVEDDVHTLRECLDRVERTCRLLEVDLPEGFERLSRTRSG